MWDRPDTLQLYLDPLSDGAHTFVRTDGRAPGPTVPLVTINQLVGDLNLDRVDFIKVDIEGAEPNAILGAKETLTSFRPRLAICVYHGKDDRSLVPEAVQKTGAAYETSCRICEEIQGQMRPSVLFFSPVAQSLANRIRLTIE